MPDRAYDEYRESHCNCIVCGSDNPISLGLEFHMADDGTARSTFCGSSLFQGYSGILHGGIVATLLDATMTHCLFHHGVSAVTGDLNVRFLKPIPFNSQLDLRAWITLSHSLLYKLESELTCGRDLLARGNARFMRKDGGRQPV